MKDRPANTILFILITGVFLVMGALRPVSARAQEVQTDDFMETIRTFAGFKDRSSGAAGSRTAAAYIKEQFAGIGLENTGSILFENTVLDHRESRLTIAGRNLDVPIAWFHSNAISPESTPERGLTGPLVYVGAGDIDAFNGKPIAGSILLMDFDSGRNWLHAASLGAKALIYVDRGETAANTLFREKMELTPVRFPRFWMPITQARELFGDFETSPGARVAESVELTAATRWDAATGENIYGLISGSDPELSEELLILEAFYDSRAFVPGSSPGADAACGIATLLQAARFLKHSPPARSILIVATDAHAQNLAGMREMIWSLRERSKEIRELQKNLRQTAGAAKKRLRLLEDVSTEAGWVEKAFDAQTGIEMKAALEERIKTEIDILSRHLMRLRLQDQTPEIERDVKNLAGKRLVLRRASWLASFSNLAGADLQEVMALIPEAIEDQKALLSDAERQQKYLRSVNDFRSLAKSKEIAAVVSLHLSSHGDGIGAFNKGWLYPLKPNIDRVNAYSRIDGVLRDASSKLQASGVENMYKDTLRPSRLRPWESYFLDRPSLGGEVSSLAGYIGVTLATVYDGRLRWGTPYDVPEHLDGEYAARQSRFVCGLIRLLAQAPALHADVFPRNGFSTVSGRANFLRQGELFADQPAPGSVILAYQHLSRFYSMVDAMGVFRLKGVADKKHVLHKVIIEGYRFDPVTGEVEWAIDKEKTGKDRYRVKMQRQSMETELIMFACKGTTLYNLLEPRTFQYMTRIGLFDARTEAAPLRYWWSRIDTRNSTLASVYVESGTRLKMTLSDTVLQRKLILTHATHDHPEGIGYLIDEWPSLHRTEYLVARDMWLLLEPRIQNLETHGIYNEKIRSLQKEGTDALAEAQKALTEARYDRFYELAKRSWALACRVYDHVESTQKDVLFGVLFYIALFVPFAFCAERLIFGYSSIYKRILAFVSILVALIAVIYKVHPAFQLAYSPMVVILAFFIMGLSMMVTLIIFFRFESEMVLLQRRARQIQTEEISRWKAFLASFLLGVSNLRRRRLRTGLTCVTLIILTFTIMSFTSVKTMRRHARILYQPAAPYHGFLLKHAGWRSLPREALGVFYNAFEEEGVIAPRVWLEADDRTRTTRIPVQRNGRMAEAQGLVGLSAQEAGLTGLDQILVGGRWLNDDERHSILLSETMASRLEIDSNLSQDTFVSLWGVPYRVVGVFSGQKFQEHTDLDGEPLTPVTFPSEISMEMTEVEVEALESGEDIESFQSRYQHVSADLTVIVPYRTLLAAGGQLKGVAVRFTADTPTQKTAQYIVDRFGLSLFSGEEDGTFLYNASDTMSYSGVPNIAIPLVISILIVLNTMISSVYERKREIGTYTSIGLAPSHVSFLFVAESLAFAVLSVVLGYLTAQTTASLFAGTALWAGITVNYSSLAGVAAMLLVILVVLISVIYPSRVAAAIAIPDVNRSWRLPEAEENRLEITLPFLMKYHEYRSIGGYLYDYLQSHQEVTHGLFSTGEIEVGIVCPHRDSLGIGSMEGSCETGHCCKEACLKMETAVWLAPFDFGIMQRVEVKFCPSAEQEGFLEIKVRLERESGEAAAWHRTNKGFLNAIRKQLLVWRSLDKPSRSQYEQLLVAASAVRNRSAETTMDTE